MNKSHAFTTTYDRRVNVLNTEIGICLPVTKEEAIKNPPKTNTYIAVWDTGATVSVITEKVVKELNLKPTGITNVQHAGGKSSTNTYLVNIVLPNGVVVQGARVIKGVLIDNPAEALIGMDIIGVGDFAVTHCNSKGGTTMSFRMPSQEEVDYVHGKGIRKVKIGRNDTCPCGSGVKFKRCCMNKR